MGAVFIITKFKTESPAVKKNGSDRNFLWGRRTNRSAHRALRGGVQYSGAFGMHSDFKSPRAKKKIKGSRRKCCGIKSYALLLRASYVPCIMGETPFGR